MKLDMHTHTKLAKNLGFSENYTRNLLEEAKAAGLDAICVTEHFNTIGFEKIYDFFIQNSEKEGDVFLIQDMKVFPGMEVDIAEGGHITVFGTVEKILAMNKALEPHKNKGNFISFEELLVWKEKYQVWLIAAHTFREESQIGKLDKTLISKLDCIELNGKDLVSKGKIAAHEIETFAKTVNLPVIAGSDTHQFCQFGCIYNVFSNHITTYQQLFSDITQGDYEIQIHKNAKEKVKLAGILKRALKEIHTLGGDYTAVL